MSTRTFTYIGVQYIMTRELKATMEAVRRAYVTDLGADVADKINRGFEKRVFERHELGTVSNVTTPTGPGVTDEGIRRMIKILDEANVPQHDRYIQYGDKVYHIK